MRRILVAACLAVMASGAAWADDMDADAAAAAVAAAQANLSVDFARCYVYFTIAAEGVRRHDETELAQEYTAAASAALMVSAGLSNMDVTAARAELLLEQLMAEMRGSFSNFEILYLRYGEACRDLIENPDDHFRDRISEELAREQSRLEGNPFRDP